MGLHVDYPHQRFFCALTVPMFLTASLFSGSIAMRWQEKRGRILPSVTTMQDLRVYVLGPVTEELVFRSCMVPMLVHAGISYPVIIFVSPLIFGLAHVHHALEFIRQGRSIASALLTVGKPNVFLLLGFSSSILI